MDAAKRRTLLSEIEAMDADGPAAPVVPAARFFDGNDDDASIAANLPDHPGVARFAAIVAAVEARPDVQGVLVGITDPMAEDEGSWPYTDTLYVLTSATPAAVREWFAEVEPDEVSAGFPEGRAPVGAPALAPGMAPVLVWWD